MAPLHRFSAFRRLPDWITILVGSTARRLAPVLALVGLAYFLGPQALTLSASWLVADDPLRSSDVIVALGGDSLNRREAYAAELYRRGLGDWVVVSDTPVARNIRTGVVAGRFVEDLGVPRDRVLLIGPSFNTRQEASYLARLMRARGLTSAIVVTDPYHSRRALYTMRREAPDLRFSSAPLPQDRTRWRADGWWRRRGSSYHTLREWISWGNTVVGGLR